jgi:hypothetical protein
MDYEEKIRNIIIVLQGVQVHGSENWDRLLTCDRALRSILQDREQKKHQENSGEVK